MLQTEWVFESVGEEWEPVTLSPSLYIFVSSADSTRLVMHVIGERRWRGLRERGADAVEGLVEGGRGWTHAVGREVNGWGEENGGDNVTEWYGWFWASEGL